MRSAAAMVPDFSALIIPRPTINRLNLRQQITKLAVVHLFAVFPLAADSHVRVVNRLFVVQCDFSLLFSRASTSLLSLARAEVDVAASVPIFCIPMGPQIFRVGAQGIRRAGRRVCPERTTTAGKAAFSPQQNSE